MKDGAEYIAKAIRLEYCPQWGEDAWSWTLRSDYTERIVRCKDCKHAKWKAKDCDGTDIYKCDRQPHFEVQPDGFCKWGKPKEEDTCR